MQPLHVEGRHQVTEAARATDEVLRRNHDVRQRQVTVRDPPAAKELRSGLDGHTGHVLLDDDGADPPVTGDVVETDEHGVELVDGCSGHEVLLAIEDVLVAPSLRSRDERGQVRAIVRLRQRNGALLRPGDQVREELVAGCLRLGHHHHARARSCCGEQGLTDRPELRVPEHRLDGDQVVHCRQTLASVLSRHRQSEKPVLPDVLDHLGVRHLVRPIPFGRPVAKSATSCLPRAPAAPAARH